VSSSSQPQPVGEQPATEKTSHYADIPPQVYEITWQSGHVETVIAHQVSWPNNAAWIFAGSDRPSRIQFHAEVDGLWTLQLSALEGDLRTIRNITNGEQVLPGGAA
jgi:hypothetical protein